MTASAYAEKHKADWVPIHYDEVIYDPAGYDTFIWSIQRPLLLEIVRQLSSGRQRYKYLDFACGTGRIISAVEALTTEATGLDISPQMVGQARTRTSEHADLKHGDILDDPEIVAADYDLITAFRFFLNTEPEMRARVMHTLAGRLDGPDSRLIFNVHGNLFSTIGFKSMYQWLRGWGRATSMTYPQIRRLVQQSGLRIDRVLGFGLFPHRLYRTPVAPILKRVDTWACRQPVLKWISNDLLFVCRPAA